ncbi:MAG: alpha-L-glutamate ligase-like protein [Pseudomonadota bacterium]
MLARLRDLRHSGVLGINERNSDYIMRCNPRRLFPLVDNKVNTKNLAIGAEMAVPELYGLVQSQADARRLGEIINTRESFVIKPASGSGGDGIVVIDGRRKGRFRTIGGRLVALDDLVHHVSNIVGGQYSLTGAPDSAIVEYCVRFDPLFEQVSFRGVPDVRVVVYRGYPVMAMVRMPTQASDGKANLHQGAVGAGVDLATGLTLRGVQGNSPIDEHPDTGYPIAGVAIRRWPFILESAARCYDVTGLGYLGVDMVIDRDLGPLILELNARPGLNIQIANASGLRPRLDIVDREFEPAADASARADYSAERFGVASS